MSTGPLPYDFEPTYTEEELQNRPSLDETVPDIEPPSTTSGQNRESRGCVFVYISVTHARSAAQPEIGQAMSWAGPAGGADTTS